jgi:uncharacterized protein YcsI (UPF0317 family)
LVELNQKEEIVKKYTVEDIATMKPKEFRSIVRKAQWAEACHDACLGYVVTGFAAVPKKYAYDFLLFCLRNPRPCPVLDVTEPGDPHPMIMAPDADVRTDIPLYRVFKNGKIVDEPTDIKKYWKDDMVGFLLGCSRSIDLALLNANVKYHNNGIFNTNIELVPAGPFHGKMAVSCRTLPTSYDAVRSIQVTTRMIAYHGPPVHIGEPSVIGIKSLRKPDFPLPYRFPAPKPGEVNLFWACSITPHNVALASKIPLMITQYQGCLFVTDKLIEELTVL